MSSGSRAEGRHPALGEPATPLDATSSHDGWFRGFAERTGALLGRPPAFLCALGLIVVWAAAGPSFSYSEEWQIVINTSTTIVTFLMVFLLQNTQARDSRAIHIKLNELLRAVADARNDLVNVEALPDARIEELRSEFASLNAEPAE